MSGPGGPRSGESSISRSTLVSGLAHLGGRAGRLFRLGGRQRLLRLQTVAYQDHAQDGTGMRFRALHVATMADSAAQRHLAVPDLDFYAVRIEADVIGKTFAQ